ncbi:hypothetical protein IFM89_009974 [Coptis chinensis]|uniref:Retrotransposon Copia-like N-terminal domain-containing protein n=1 Tax=Coptis chinensis TaxID=261450 RepID=A0A835HJN4_9MAGN|nr:hypothetical protein IFM89_009974 [Coptis chinensis]
MSTNSSTESIVSETVTTATEPTFSIPTITNLVTVKLNNDNFLLWSHLTEAFLIGQNLYKFVDGLYPCRAITDPSYNIWLRTDKTLEYFSQRSVPNSSQIWRNLNEISRGTHTVSEYLQEAKTYADTLAAIGEPVKNTDLVNAILCGLGFEYEMLITALESLKTLPQFSALRSRLLIYESRHHASPPLGPSTLLASHASS